MGQRAANRYAKALLNFGIENKSTDSILSQVKDIHSSIKNSSDLRSILNSPVIKNEDKEEILKSIFKTSDAVFHNLFDTLSINNRFDHLAKICEAYIHLYNDLHNILEAHIKSAVELDKDTLKAFSSKIKDITGYEATITTTVDEDLIGGFILNIKNLQYDASISGKLNKLRQNLHTR